MRTTSISTGNTGRIATRVAVPEVSLRDGVDVSVRGDRVKLIMSILKCDPNENGAGLVLEKLLKAEIILAAFPLHDRSRVAGLPVEVVGLIGAGRVSDQPFVKLGHDLRISRRPRHAQN